MQSVNWAMWIIYDNVLGCLEKWTKEGCNSNINREKDV